MTFEITDTMKKRAEKNREGLESQFMDTKRTYGIAFTDTFWNECKGNFDMWGLDEQYLMYCGDVAGMTVIIDGDLRWDTAEEFLDQMDYLENKRISLNEKYKKADY